MAYNVTVCPRCGECTYDPDYKCCLNEDCRLEPLSNGLHLALIVATALMLLLVVISQHVG